MLKLLKMILILAVMVGIVYGGLWTAKKYLPAQISERLPDAMPYINALTPVVQQQLAQAGNKAPALQQVGAVLGAQTSNLANSLPTSGNSSQDNKDNKDSNAPAPTQQALEQIRYIYCQQVVKDYEARYMSSPSSSAK